MRTTSQHRFGGFGQRLRGAAIAWLLAMWMLAGAAFVGPASGQPNRASFEHFSTTNGLSNYAVTSLLQDHVGFLWIGTQGGLNRYDGYEFRVYSADNSGLTDDFIQTLFEDSRGVLWVGTQHGGLFAFNEEGITQYAHQSDDPASLSHNEVLAIEEDAEGAIWVGTRNGLNRLDLEAGRFASALAGASAPAEVIETIWALHADPSGRMWIGSDAGLFVASKAAGGEEYRVEKVREIDGPVRALAPGRNGRLWVGTQENGLIEVEPGSGPSAGIGPRAAKIYRHDPADRTSLPSDYILSVVEDGRGNVWIGTYDGGLARLDLASERITQFVNEPENPASLPHDQVQAVLVDRSGILWAGTWGGLAKHVPPLAQVLHYTHIPDDPNSLSHPRVASIYEDQSGIVWIGTQGGGLNRLNRATGRIDRISLPFADVISICEDHSGELWIGTRENVLYHFDRESEAVTPYPLDPDRIGRSDEIVLTIYEAPSEPGTLWIGTRRSGLYVFDTATRRVVRHYPPDPANPTGLSHAYAWPIYEDRTGILWIGTLGGGLNRLNRETGEFTRFVHDPDDPGSISGDRVVAIHEDTKGRLWIGTFGRGLNRLDRATGTFAHYTVQQGLPSDDILGILSDAEGRLWISTNDGLARFDAESGSVLHYGPADGMQSSIFHIGATFRSAGGELLFGGTNGINIIRPDDERTSPAPAPPVVLTDIRVLGEPLRLPMSPHLLDEIRLGHRENFVTFVFSVLDFADPPRNHFAYRLDGVDPDWVQAGTQREIRYPKLGPGTYTFHVRGAGSNNVWNEEGASIRLIIRPPWWRTTWAYLLYVIGALLVGAGAYTWRVQRLKNRAAALERMVDERTEALRIEKRKTEEQAERLLELEEVKDRFFANISHEFRTPLTLILGPVEDALGGFYGTIPDSLQRQLEVMGRSGRRLHRLINQLLDLSKLEIGRMHLHARRISLAPFIREIALSFSALAERRGIILQFQADTRPVYVWADSDKLEKVITNLVSNALKFTPSGGKVWISVRKVPESEVVSTEGDGAFAPARAAGKAQRQRETENHPLARTEWVEIQVRDTGSGISADDLPHIFDRFYQADSARLHVHEGTGIGLALARELVELHGGTIDVESVEGFGTTFFVRLRLGRTHLHPDELVDGSAELDDRPGPQMDRAEERVDSPEEKLGRSKVPIESDTAPGRRSMGDSISRSERRDVLEEIDTLSQEENLTPTDGQGDLSNVDAAAPTILVVEDNRDVRAYLRSHLDPLYHVAEATDGAEGLAQVRSLVPDLVISDVMMPEFDGLALCAAIKEDPELNHIPVILLTAKATDDSKIEGLSSGADDYIYKPFNAGVLLARVDNLLAIRKTLRDRFSSEVRIGPTEVSVSSMDASFLERVREVVEQHLSDSNFGADWLSDEIGMSRRHLSRRLRETANLTPAGYIRMMRLERAAQLLRQRAGTVSEIAYQVGYKNADHFSRVFQQAFDVPPSRYPAE